MSLSETSGYIFSSNLKINYDLRFIRTAQDWVKNLAMLSGANETESYQLTMLVEDVLVFVLDKYTDEKLKAHIDIGYQLFNDGKVTVEISDMGRPIHEEKLPQFNIHDTDTADGLWYQMVKEMADGFEFVNLLNQGWLIRVEKRIKQCGFVSNPQVEIVSRLNDAPVPGKLSIRKATDKDVTDLVDLAFLTYRYSYAVHAFYNADLLRKCINEKLYDIMVVEVNQRIIGAISIKYSVSDPRSAEMGSAMIHPDYRGTRALALIIRETDQYHKENPRQIDFFFSVLVTTHARSQKSVEKVHAGYKPLSISLNMVPRANYIGIKDVPGTRESVLNAYHLNRALEMDKVHVPARHAGIISELIENFGNSVAICTETAVPGEAHTVISNVVNDSWQSAIVTVETFGETWFTKLCKTLLALTASGYKTIYVSLPTRMPLPIGLDEKLTDLNLIFCGLSLRSLKDVRLSYVLISEPIDFSLIELFSPIAKKLLTHIEEQYNYAIEHK